MNAPTPSGKYLRTRAVLKLTGWNRSYLDKLRERGVLRAFQPYPKAWNWYKEQDILELLNGRNTKALKP